jgi:hypothetical protein
MMLNFTPFFGCFLLIKKSLVFIHPSEKVINKFSVDNSQVIDYKILISKILTCVKRVSSSEIVGYKDAEK